MNLSPIPAAVTLAALVSLLGSAWPGSAAHAA